jgi:hypothetical protein
MPRPEPVSAYSNGHPRPLLPRQVLAEAAGETVPEWLFVTGHPDVRGARAPGRRAPRHGAASLRIGPEGEVMAIRPSGAFRRCGGRRRARPHPSGPRSACGPASRWAGARAARAASRSPVSRPPSRMARWRAEKRSRTDQARAVARATGASPDAKTYASPGPSSPSASTRLPPQSAAAASGLRTSAVQTRSNGASAER